MEQQAKRKRSIWYSGEYFDYVMFFVVIFLVCFGLVMVYSTSSYKGATTFGDSMYYLRRQGIFAVLGIITMLFISKIDYHFWMKFSKVIYFVMIGLLLLVFIIGSASHGATRWIKIGPIQFQPSEIAKIGLILYTAHLATVRSKKLNTLKQVIGAMILPVIAIGLIATENLSTAVVCFCIVAVIIFVTCPKYWHFILLAVLGIAFIVVFIFAGGYRQERIEIWLDVENHPKGYQTLQSLYAIGSGGIFGKGLGNSIQKLGFVPESHNDMIFSIICEELGLFGAACIICVFILLLYRFMVIANSAPDLYGSLIVVGVLTHVAVQVLINIAVVTNSMPNTGIPLPFISYGGTSLVILLAEMGLVLSVSRHIRLNQ